MGFKLAACNDDQTWDDFVDRSLQGSVFCNAAFLSALGRKLERWLVSENAKVVAAYPVLLNDTQPIAAPHRFTLYQGLMFHPEVDSQPFHRGVQHKLRITDFLLEQMAERYSRISLCTHPNLGDIRSFLWFNYHQPEKGVFSVQTCYTGLLNLRQFERERHLSEMRAVRRSEIVRAGREGYKAVESNDIDTLDRLHDLTFKRQGLTRLESDGPMVHSIAEAALKHGFGRCLMAIDPAGNVASANLILLDKRVGHYLIGANHPDFRKSGASAFLLLEAIEHAAKSGARYFDFVGINSPNRGDYKVSFNAQPVAYYTLDWKRPQSYSN
jgi:Acetyltransferase (GNAT) domain